MAVFGCLRSGWNATYPVEVLVDRADLVRSASVPSSSAPGGKVGETTLGVVAELEIVAVVVPVPANVRPNEGNFVSLAVRNRACSVHGISRAVPRKCWSKCYRTPFGFTRCVVPVNGRIVDSVGHLCRCRAPARSGLFRAFYGENGGSCAAPAIALEMNRRSSDGGQAVQTRPRWRVTLLPSPGCGTLEILRSAA